MGESAGGAPRAARTRRWGVMWVLAVLAAALFVAGCGSSDDDGGSSGSATSGETTAEVASGEIGPAETTDLTVAIPYPDSTMYSFYYVADELGYYEDEGLRVRVITADNPIAAVVGGSAQVSVADSGAVVDAQRKDLGVSVLSGHFCRQNYSVAVQPDIRSVDQLDGKDIVLAGTTGDPQEFQREKVLADEGWDLSRVDAKTVYPGPDSATWREFFLDNKVALMPFYDDDRDALDRYGANIIVDTVRPWPNSWQIAKTDWLKDNPNTAVRFLRATMRAVQYMTAPAVGRVPENKDAVLDILEGRDLEVADLRKDDSPWVLSGMQLCPNLYYDQEAWDVTIESQDQDPLDYTSDTSYLERAQRDAGLDNSPPTDISSVYP